MTKPHGRMNKHGLEQFASSVGTSGILRSSVDGGGSYTFDVNQPVALLQKSSALVAGAGRLVIAKGNNYIPAYTLAVGTSIGSGYVVPSNGIYQVDAVVAVSGVAIEMYGGAVLVNGVAASGTASFAASDARGAAAVKINGVVHAYAGQTINVGVKSVHGNLTTIGSEDLTHAPAANLRIVKLGSDELSQTGS